jgi:flagellar biosynthesis/type III secretory pathway M-ring protein FliF/YscJ
MISSAAGEEVDMAWVFVGILLLVLIVFGVSSSAQSYATVQQAEAMKKVAEVAQINAWGNLILIVAILVILLVILAAIAAFVYLRIRVDAAKKQPVREPSEPSMLPSKSQMDMILYAMMFRMLGQAQPPQQSNLIEMPKEDVEAEDPFPWLR